MTSKSANEILEEKLSWLQQRTGTLITGVLHVGAHIGQETSVYEKLGFRQVIWIEGNRDVYQRLLQRLAAFPTQKAYCCVASDTDGQQIKFYITNNDGESSSVLPIAEKKMEREYPNLHVSKTTDAETSRLDSFFSQHNVDISLCNFLNVDVQGYELAAIRGLGALISNFSYICCEVNLARIYWGASLFYKLDWYITGQGFRRVWLSVGGVQGEALYVRSRMTRMERMLSYAVCLALEISYFVGLTTLVRRNKVIFSLMKKLYSGLKGRRLSE